MTAPSSKSGSTTDSTLETRDTRLAKVGLCVAFALLSGCSTVQASAIRTGSVRLPAYSGPVAIEATGRPPPGAIDLGVVEVRAAQSEGTVEVLLPRFIQKVAEIGGDIAVVDGIRARFDLVNRVRVEPFYYTCGQGYTCGGTRVYNTNDEVMTVSITGHAYRSSASDAKPPAPPPESKELPVPPAPSPEEAAPRAPEQI